MTALVSVVIPTYNHASLLGRALQSVLDQTYPHWEALVVDNHSDDNTDEIVNAIRDPRIRLLKIHNHGVIAASRNLGIREARGEWIAFLDSDDCWYPRKLERLMGVAASDAYDVLSNDELMVDLLSGMKKILRYGPYEEDFYRTLLLNGNRLSTSATVVRREYLVRHGLAFDESQSYVTVEDYGLWLDLARTGASFSFINEVLGEYVVHGANHSGQLSRHLQNGVALLHDHIFTVQQFEPNPERLWRAVLPRLRIGEIRQLAAGGGYAAAVKVGLGLLVNSPGATARYLSSKLGSYLKKRSP
jgi:GT2 family glycosyltransferase